MIRASDLMRKMIDHASEGSDGGAISAMYNPAIFVLAGTLIGLTLADTLRETAKARELDKMLAGKLEETVEELHQLRAQRDAIAIEHHA